MDITPSQLVLLLIIVALVIALLYSTFLHARTNRTNAQGQIDILGAIKDAVKDFMDSELIVGISKAAARNVDPEAMVDLINRINAEQVVVGADTGAGQLLNALEEYLRIIDTDPTNDPVKVVAGVRQIIAANKPVPVPKG